MRVLFTGGTGRLSKDVVSRAVGAGFEVYVLNRGSASRTSFVPEGCVILHGDIRDAENCKKLLSKLDFDVVIDFLSFNVEQLKTTLSILENKFDQYIFISSATVYEDVLDGEAISEDCTPAGNRKWDYAYKKYECEKYLEEQARNGASWHYTIVRPYVTYGNTRIPYPIITQNGLAEWTLLDRILRHQPIVVCDFSNVVTTLTHTRDFAKAVVGLMGNPLAYNEAFHITADETNTWDDVLEAIEDALGFGINRVILSKEELLHFLPEYSSIILGDKGRDMRFDNSKIKNAVPEYSCEISLADGVRDTISYMQENQAVHNVDNLWNGRMDWVCKSHFVKTENYPHGQDLKEQLKYFIGNHPVVYRAYRHMAG